MRLRSLGQVFLAGFCLIFSITIGFAESRETCSLLIHVEGIRNQKGVIGASIFNSPDGWPESNNKAFRHGPAPFTGSEGTISFEGIPPGDYGVVVIHDENKNQKLDRNFVGWPTEGFGFANNPKVGLSAPPFAAALAHVTCPKTDVTIHLIYK